MRVKITKTVDINDLAAESRQMLDQIKNRVVYGLAEQMQQVIRASLSNQGEEYFQAIHLIDEFRQRLAAIDENLQEVSNIMQGYKDALMPPQSETHSPEDPDQDWIDNEQAEYEKQMSRVSDLEEEAYEEG